MQSRALKLRPMDVGDLLDETFALYRQNFSLFAGIAAVFIIPETIITAIVTGVFTASGPAAGSVLLFIFGLLLGYLFQELTTAALALAISARYLDRAITVGEAYASVGVSTFVTLIVALIIEGVLVVVGFFLLVIPGIYLAVSFVFVAQTVVLERTGAWQGLQRSRELVRGSWWRVFFIWLLVSVLVGILTAIVQGVFHAIVALAGASGVTTSVISSIASGATSIFLLPVQLGALTLLYYDLRIRKEGFDIELAAMSLEGNPRSI